MIFQANDILLSFHRVLSVQLTMPQVHYSDPVYDDDDVNNDDDNNNTLQLDSLSSDSLEAATVAVY